MSKHSELVDYVFEERQHSDAVGLAKEVLLWMEISPRFTAFVETYHDKIRKKVRVTREPESLFDLASELEVARSLLNDRRFQVAYEPVASEKRRGPDFAVTYRSNLIFNIEVARLRVEEREIKEIQRARKEERIQRILLDKLGQMQAGAPNLLAIHTRPDLARSIDLIRLMQEIKTRAEGKDLDFYAASRYNSPAAFYKDFLRLSGIVLWTPGARPWINKQARPALEEKIIMAVAQAAGG